jgi:hypothetical protein
MGDDTQKHKGLQKAHSIDFPTKAPEADGPFELASSFLNLPFFTWGPRGLPLNELFHVFSLLSLFAPYHKSKI